MQIATETARLAQQLTMLEVRAAGLRPIAAPVPVDNGSELRLVIQQHGALLFELVKAALRAFLLGTTAFDARTVAIDAGADPLTQRRQGVEAKVLAQFTAWEADVAAGRALPPVHDAPKFATTITESIQ